MDESTTLIATVPKLESLCYIRCIFSNIQMNHEILKEIYHCQIVYCRDIIRYFPDAIASPVPGSEHYVYVIVSKKFYKTKKLQRYLKMKFVHFTDSKAVDFEIYKICVKYSIIYKLLPNWRRIGEYLCNGRNSTDFTYELEAIKFDLDIKDEGMYLKFNPLKLQLHPFSLKRVEMAKSTIKKIRNNPHTYINSQHQKAHILPTLKKCKLLTISKEIPKTCPFKSYDIIRDHWKHMYGVIMPKNPKDISYCEVIFRGFERRIFVYPHICLQSEMPEIIEYNNQTKTKKLFLEDLKLKVPQICGEELSFDYHIAKLTTNFVKPKEMQRSIYNTPSRSSLVKNPCYSSSSSNLRVSNYDPKNVKKTYFQMSFNSSTKSIDSNSISFSLQDKLSIEDSSKKEATTSSKIEAVNKWLWEYFASPASSIETESLQSRDELEKTKNSPLRKRMRFTNVMKPSIRSIEPVRISLSPFRKKLS